KELEGQSRKPEEEQEEDSADHGWFCIATVSRVYRERTMKSRGKRRLTAFPRVPIRGRAVSTRVKPCLPPGSAEAPPPRVVPPRPQPQTPAAPGGMVGLLNASHSVNPAAREPVSASPASSGWSPPPARQAPCSPRCGPRRTRPRPVRRTLSL